MRINGRKIQSFFLRNGYLLISAAWLITLAFLINNYWWFTSSPSNVQQLLESNIQKRENHFNKIASDTALMHQLLNRNYNGKELKEFTGRHADFYLFFYQGNWETFWTTNQIAMDSSINTLPEGVHFRQLKSGYYEIIRKNLDSTDYVLCLLPVKEQYYFSNPYLPDRYYQLPRISNQYHINMERVGLPVKSITGKRLFSIQNYSNATDLQGTWLSGILLALAIVCILIFLNQFALHLGKRTNDWWGFLFLCAAFILLRALSYWISFPFAYEDYPLFDATIYASNDILRSLGDLLINVILIGWIILYAYNQLEGKLQIRRPLSRVSRIILMFLIGLATFYIVSFGAGIIRGLVVNSKLSFDVTDFFSLNIYSFIGFIILGLLGFCFFFLSPVINYILNQLSEDKLPLKYIVLGLSGLAWLSLQLFQETYSYTLWVMLWCIFYIYLLDLSGQRLGRKISMERFILWLIVLTSTITAIMVFYNSRRELDYRQQLAIHLTKQKDPTLIFNLGTADTAITEDPYVASYFKMHDSRKKNNLADYLLNTYFPNLQNKYDFTFYTFDRDGRPMIRQNRENMSEATLRLTQDAAPTGFMNLFFRQINISEYYYVATLPIQDPMDQKNVGFLYYRLEPKTLKPQSLYPELLMQTTDYRFKKAINKYSYAVYDHLKLAYHHNSYPFPLQLKAKEVPDMDFNILNKGGYSILRYKPSSSKVIVMVKQDKGLIEAITLFAYLFGIFLLLVLLFNIFRILVKSRLRFHEIRERTRLNIRNQVHAIIIFIVLFVFIVLGASTIKFYVNRYDSQHHQELEREMNSLLARVENAIYENSGRNASVRFYNLDFDAGLQSEVQKIADMDAVDINIYDLDGNLRISTQSLIYKNGLLSWKMDPTAYYKLFTLHQAQVIQKEQVGDLSFLSSYMPIWNKNGELLAFLNQPYYASQSDLKEGISGFLVTLINLNAFIFLLAGLLALLFTHRITRSFTLIINKLRQVNLSGKNEEIDWEYDDEIGSVVKEYNKMVRKLEESAAKLAQSEREGAWRKMARQVAHEIKNPLTPMKLSLQYLQRAIKDDSPRKDELANSVSQTLIEQMDHLSQIASDFSTFANINHAKKEEIILNEVLASVVSLHQGYERLNLTYKKPEVCYKIYADKTQINRVFTNLIQNAMQAIPEEEEGAIAIETFKEGSKVVVRVADNGSGIPPDLQDKIFTPNFTTKSSGTGLGLAICKNIIQESGGEIRFETVEGKGTVFFVKLPLIDS